MHIKLQFTLKVIMTFRELFRSLCDSKADLFGVTQWHTHTNSLHFTDYLKSRSFFLNFRLKFFSFLFVLELEPHFSLSFMTSLRNVECMTMNKFFRSEKKNHGLKKNILCMTFRESSPFLSKLLLRENQQLTIYGFMTYRN